MAFTGQALFVELGTWYWTSISQVANLWDDRVLRSGVPVGRSMEHLWIRSSDSDILDGRFYIVEEGEKGAPFGSPVSASLSTPIAT